MKVEIITKVYAKNKFILLSVTHNDWQWTSLKFESIDELKQVNEEISKFIERYDK